MGAMERRKKKEAAVRSDDKGARNAAWMRPKLAKRSDQPRLDRDLNTDSKDRGLVFQKITRYKKQMCVFHLQRAIHIRTTTINLSFFKNCFNFNNDDSGEQHHYAHFPSNLTNESRY